MKNDPIAIVLLKWGCWAFVTGVGLANIIGPQEQEFMMKMWIACGTFAAVSVYLMFAAKYLVKYALFPALMVFGIASYQLRFDTSNPDHIKNFKDTERWGRTLVRGTIIEDPDIRDMTTHLVVHPEEVAEDPAKSSKLRELSGRTGNIVVFVSKKIRPDNPYYNEMAYGDRIEVVGALTEPMVKTNPFGFDYARYLRNKNIYASIYIGEYKNIRFLSKSDLGFMGKIKSFAYSIKDRMILGIKKTIPPPASAFIGGVTIGARGGVPEVMKYDFQATGVAHVLALSGLHVGFLAFMLIMFFNNIFKSAALFYVLPSKLMKKEVDLTPYTLKLIPLFVIIVLGLFVLVTGARPATVRAAMMYSIGVVFNMWLGLNLARTGSITIPLSAAIMLGMNSFLIFEASFALSFTAVWSIIYLSGPLRQIFSRILVGWGQLVFFFFFFSVITLMVVFPWVFGNPVFVKNYIFLLAVLAGVAYFLEREYPLTGFEFEGWWPGISSFFVVQLSIQIGMMWPLSGVWFNRFPVAGMLANFIAIPLIGLIVPLGILGELFTFVPVIGTHLGLAIGATNLLCTEFFLGMAKFFRTYFPYPIQSAASNRWLAVYYLMVCIFAFNRSIRKFLTVRLGFSRKLSTWTVLIIIAFIYSTNYWLGDIVKGKRKEKDELLITLLDVDYANSIIIQLPTGKNLLIDGGFRGDSRYWTMGKWGKGSTVIIPNLSGYNISKIDKLISTNPLPENIGGLIYVLEHFRVDEVWDSLDPEKFRKGISYADFLNNLDDFNLYRTRNLPLAIGSYINYYDFLNFDYSLEPEITNSPFKKKNILRKHIYEEVVIYRDSFDGKIIELKALNPPEERLSGTSNDLYNNSAVLKLTYGNRTFLFPSNILEAGEARLIEEYGEELESDVLILSDHGNPMGNSEDFLDTVDPIYACFQFGYLKGRSFYSNDLDRTLGRLKIRKIKYYRTDKNGAIEIRSNGESLDVKTIL